MNNKEFKEKSVIMSALDGLASKIYGLLAGGIFGRFFTSYSPENGKIGKKIAGKNRFYEKTDEFRRKAARNIESSITYGLYGGLAKRMLSFRMRVYGTAILTFFLYAAAVSLFGFIRGDEFGIPVDFITYLLLAVSSIPLTLSGESLYGCLRRSRIGKCILAVTGNSAEKYETHSPSGKCNIAFLIGTVLGLATFVLPANTIGQLVLRGVWALIVLNSPEFGIVSLCFLMPFDGTMILVAEVSVVFVSFIIKLILGKRTLKFEAVTVAALMFALMMVVGGVCSISASSMKPMLVYLCFMSVYFLIVSLMRSEEWLRRCVIATVSAGTIVAAYGIFQYMTGIIGFSTQWLDEEMFEDISGRAFSTLENPNVLGEYLVMIIPMAAALFLCRLTDPKKKFAAFASFGCMCVCLVVTWSRGAWLGMILAALLFCLMWTKRTLHMFWPALLAVPFLPMVLPANVLTRITSIGNLADSSTAYRFKIWLGTLRMLPDRILSGIGIGSGAWEIEYPKYALDGMNGAQHSHSLFFQIWVELGAVALLIFIAFIIMLFMSNLTMYKSLSESGAVIASRIKTAPLKEESEGFVRVEQMPEEKRIKREMCRIRMDAAAPLCGVAGVLLQGLTDNIWYNYRVYLMFWICLGLCAAYAAFGRERIDNSKEVLESGDKTAAVADIELTARSRRNEKKKKGTGKNAET